MVDLGCSSVFNWKINVVQDLVSLFWTELQQFLFDDFFAKVTFVSEFDCLANAGNHEKDKRSGKNPCPDASG